MDSSKATIWFTVLNTLLSGTQTYGLAWVSVFLFILGMGINIHSDYILRRLRKPGETTYRIPQGGLFTYVSGANFLGEIIEWIGYALASCELFTTIGLPGNGYCLAVGCRFYLKMFEDYPKSRKALIPFIF
ncbi:3-oxo-5-alpha-steroid 4-dehydrogenase 2 [Camelus dromedarius]|uniref:3-oxo-5-alpha-steroid 4-dehydrogenase 2 n=1 Tax=Camelus dromedarius TaxID=9838 RepID=A0A5N4D7M5_CAMDR|nr:3-oxo-5-alpha-steroid 4-dehydrogenase 2 [Camelus dromedarius]